MNDLYMAIIVFSGINILAFIITVGCIIGYRIGKKRDEEIFIPFVNSLDDLKIIVCFLYTITKTKMSPQTNKALKNIRKNYEDEDFNTED